VAPIGAAVRDTADVDRVFDALAREPNGGLMVLPDISMTNYREAIVALAARHRVPAVYPFRFFAASGGLISYGPDSIDPYRRAALYVDRILKGEKPADLPVQQVTKVQLIINLKTAKALGITIPLPLSGRADEVIE
jgi:putative ABC transport system substrate-binding protein